LHNKEYDNFGGFIVDFNDVKLDLFTQFEDPYSRSVLLENLMEKFITFSETYIDECISMSTVYDTVNQEKIKNLENFMENMRLEFEGKSVEYLDKFKQLESEKSKYKAQINVLEEKLDNIKSEKTSQKTSLDEKYRGAMNEYAEREAKLIAQVEDLKSQNRQLEMEKTQILAKNDKEIAMKSQQLQFSEIQICQLS